MATETITETPVPRSSFGTGILAFLRRDRVARWTSRLALLLLWQLAGILSDRFPTPVQTVEILVREFQDAVRQRTLERLEQRAGPEPPDQPHAHRPRDAVRRS